MGLICPSTVLGACPRRAISERLGLFCCGLVMALYWAPSIMAADDACRPMTAELGSRVTQYLAQRIVSESGGVPSILSADRVPGTCYQKLAIHVSGTADPLTLYLSPDQRFLTSTLYDLDRNPLEEGEAVAADVRSLLARDDSPRLSGSRPRVVIVEFGDLQCPYCKRFSDWYRALPPGLANETTLIFKHFPLPAHPWAQLAAQYSACAGRESAAAFWDLADYFLSHQGEITPANISDKVAAAQLPHAPNVTPQNLSSCVTEGGGAGLVARDVDVGTKLHVNRTPTLYIEGRRIPPLHSQEDFQRLLERELQDQSAHAVAAGRQ
jgi:protein-disulfide isomerase